MRQLSNRKPRPRLALAKRLPPLFMEAQFEIMQQPGDGFTFCSFNQAAVTLAAYFFLFNDEPVDSFSFVRIVGTAKSLPLPN